MLTRYNIINLIAKKNNAKKYLEIGVRNGNDCFEHINIKDKDGVDPYPVTNHTNFKLTSDVFFSYINSNIKYDIIFIDGLHTHEQVNKDILNSFNHLNDGGYVLLHDSNPPTSWHATPESNGGDWNGTVYLSLIELRATRDDIHMITVDTDWGVTILKRGNLDKLNVNLQESLNYDYFNNNRQKILNLISPDKFLSLLSDGEI